MQRLNILFISRAYPPTIGGIERQNYEIARGLSEESDVGIIANTRGKKNLPLFTVYAIVKLLFMLRRYDVVLLGDGVLGIVGWAIKLFSKKPVAGIVHGLDLTYPNGMYQKLWVKIFLKRLDKLIAVGNESLEQGVVRGIPRSQLAFVPNGVSIQEPLPPYSKRDLDRIIGREVDRKVLLTLGRLVKRKGVSWFIEKVVGGFRDDFIYIIAGGGPERSNIVRAITENKLQNRVFYIGAVSERDKEILYATADLFIQPNITVPGDIEGFGLAVLEAASYGVPVIASDIEGLRDAVSDGVNGFLVPERDVSRYRETIAALLENDGERKRFGAQAREHVTKHCSWGTVAKRYGEILGQLLQPLASDS